MKKLIVMIIPLLFLFGCNKTTFEEINYKKLDTLITNKESFVLFIGANSCSHCSTYKVTLNEAIRKNNVDNVKYIDADLLSETEVSKLKQTANYTGTPTTVFIEKGKEESSYNRINGDRDYDYIVNKLQKNGYIKKVKWWIQMKHSNPQ